MTQHAYSDIVQALQANGWNIREDGNERARAVCPLHGDKDLNLSIMDTETRVNLKCFSHDCDPNDILNAIGLDGWRARYDNDRVSYNYLDQSGNLNRAVLRLVQGDKKSFRQSIKDKKHVVLYRLEKVYEAIKAAQPVYLVEGEEDVHALEAVGYTATTAPQGAGNFAKADVSPLEGATVIAIVDKDEAGDKWASQVSEKLQDVAKSLTFKQAAKGKDVSDHLTYGLGIDELEGYELEYYGPTLKTLAEYGPAEPIDWLALSRIPKGVVTAFVGEEGIGKSQFWLWLTSLITTGTTCEEFGVTSTAPANVIAVVTEDDITRTVIPRAQVAGVDLNRLAVFSDDGLAPTFPNQLNALKTAVRKRFNGQVALIVVDAWADTLPSGITLKDPKQARSALTPWKTLADELNCAVLLMVHTNRLSSTNARDKYGLSGEIRKIVRSSLYAQADSEGNFTIGPEKANLAQLVEATTFRMESIPYEIAGRAALGGVPALTPIGPSGKTVAQLLEEAEEAKQDSATDRQEKTDAEKWLARYLIENPGNEKRQVLAAASKADFKPRTIERAFQKIGGVSERNGFGTPACWYPPGWDEEPTTPISVESGEHGELGSDYAKHGGELVAGGEHVANLMKPALTTANTTPSAPSSPCSPCSPNIQGQHVCYDCNKPIPEEFRRCKECTKKLRAREQAQQQAKGYAA